MQHLANQFNNNEASSDKEARLQESGVNSENTFRLEILEAEKTEAALEIWRELESRLGNNRLMCSSQWTQTWLKHYSDIVKPRFAIGYRRDAVCGICLLSESQHQRIGPVTIRSLHIGTAGEPHGESVCVEYNEILCEPNLRNVFLTELQAHVLQDKQWDQFQLDGIICQPENDRPKVLPLTKGELEGVAKEEKSNEPEPDGAQRETSFSLLFDQPEKGIQNQIRRRESRFFDLKQCREADGDILAMLGKSTRSNLKRRIKKLDDVQVEWAESAEQAEDIFAELIDLHQARWVKQGEPGAFASSRFAAFQKEIVKTLSAAQKVVLCRIKAGEQTIGCLYLLVDDNRLLDYVSGLAAFDQFPSSGLISHYLCMQQAMERGFDAYDFLVGDKRHKENLGKSANNLQWVVCERSRVVFRLRNWGSAVKQMIKKKFFNKSSR